MISKEQLKHYNEWGWVHLPSVIPSDLLSIARKEGLALRQWMLDNNMKGKPCYYGPEVHWDGIACAMMYEQKLEKCYKAPFMREIAITLLGTDLPHLFNDQMVYKMGKGIDDDFAFEPHYDNQYGSNANNAIHTVNCSWILDDMNFRNGGLQVKDTELNYKFNAGDIVAIKGDTYHGSTPNMTDEPRGLYACVYTEKPMKMDAFYNGIFDKGR